MKERNLLERKVPVNLINEEARIEKLGTAKPPISEMHYYFTRKPLITSRMVIAGAILSASSIKSPSDFNRLMGVDPALKKRAFRSVPQDLLSKIKAKYPIGLTILDPFAGSGMMVFEALRLGINVVALDYNPVAYLVLKGTIEYPLKYGGLLDEKTGESKLYADVKRYSERIFQKLKAELNDFYPKHGTRNPRAYMIAWAVKCPTCSKITPLVNNWVLSSKENIKLDYSIKEGKIEFKILKSKVEKEGNAKGGSATCLYCSNRIENDKIVEDISANEREVILAVYLDDRTFDLPNDKDESALLKAKQYLKNNSSTLSKFIPSETLPHDMRALPASKYLAYWYKMFNPRQLLVLVSLTKEIRQTIEEISKKDSEYASAIGTYLSMILSKHINYNSRITIWHNSYKVIAHSLTNRGINMVWNHAETNPFIKFSGSLIGNTHDVLEGLEFAIGEMGRNTLDSFEKPKAELYNASILSWSTKRKFEFIITDPPYYDDVPYPELMEFFQVWHTRTIGDLLSIPPKPSISEELSVGRDRDNQTFETRMLIAIKKLHNLLLDDGVLTMFYAHSSVEGWKYLLEALRKTGFQVTSTITLMTENKANVIARGKSSVFHSLVITARKRLVDKTTTMMDAEEEIRKKIEANYPDLEETYGKDRMNLIVAASGMVIETVTKYSEIISFTKNTADYALEMGQRFLIEAFAKRTLNVEHADPKTMVYTWFRHSIQDYIDFSEFNQTLKALGAGMDTVEDIITFSKGDRSKVRLLDFSERGSLEIDGMEPLIARSMIDSVHIILRSYMRGGITAVKDLVNSSPFGSKIVLNTIDALAKISGTRSGYREGEICGKFLEEWKNIYGGEQRTFK